MNLLKIAVVRPFFTLGKGGAERYTVELVRNLIGLGHQVHVYANSWDHPEDEKIAYHHVRMARKPAWLRVLTFHHNLGRCLDPSRFDIVLGMTPFVPQVVSWLGDGLYSVWTRTVWRVGWLRWLMCLNRTVMLVNLWLERRAMRGEAEHYIANSSLVRRQAVSDYGTPEDRISVVYHGIDPRRFNPEVRDLLRDEARRELGFVDGEIVLLFISNNFKRKGLDLVIDAIAAERDLLSKIRLFVVGKGRVSMFKWRAKRRDVRDRVLFVGPEERVEKYYAAADIFVLPTRYDPFAVVCLEAMACGLPVITTRMNGAAELIKDGSNGFLIDSKDQLADRIRLLVDPKKRADMGAAAAAQARKFSEEQHIHSLVGVLSKISERRRGQKNLQVVQPDTDLVINKTFGNLLEANNLAKYENLTKTEQGTPIDYNISKRIFLFKLRHEGQRITFYLKRYHSRFGVGEWFGRLTGKQMVPEGMKEWQNVLALQAHGLSTLTPVAAGGRILSGGVKESFFMSLGLDGYKPLDSYISTHFTPPMDQKKLREKRDLLRAVARLTQNLHGTGFNHRDYYLCHLFVKAKEPNGFDLRIIDLQRVGFQMPFKRRWLVKDLASLHFSSLDTPLTDWDRFRFYVFYSSGWMDRTRRRSFLKRIIKKSGDIERHDVKIRGNLNTSHDSIRT